jgi:orotate phosphoribosyltransferase
MNSDQVDIVKSFITDDGHFDSWRLCRFPRMIEKITECMVKYVDHHCDAICALAQSGIPIGSYLASKLCRPLYIVSHKDDIVDEHGRIMWVLPEIPSEKKIVMVDSHIKTGTTASHANTLLRKYGSEVLTLCTAVDFSLPNWKNARNVSIPVASICQIEGQEDWLVELLGVSNGTLAEIFGQTDFWSRVNNLPTEIPDFPRERPGADFAPRVFNDEVEKTLWKFMQESTGYGLYSLFLNPELLSDSFAKVLQTLDTYFDAVVACSLHGFVFAAWLLQILHSRGTDIPLYYLSHTARFLRNPPNSSVLEKKQVLLFDAIVRTGGHASYSYNICKTYGATPNAFLCLLDCDNTRNRARLHQLSTQGIRIMSLARASRAPDSLLRSRL